MNDEKPQVNLPSESDFPLNLRYADVIPPVLEFEIVKKMGQRYRRRYRAAIGTSVTASMAAATLFACTIASTNSSSTAAPGGTQPTASALPTAVPGVAAYPSAFTINPDLPTQYMNQWSFDIQRGLWRGGALDVEYIGSHGALHRRLLMGWTAFQLPPDRTAAFWQASASP